MSGTPNEVMRPFFTICIPAYNAARFLPACLESIRQQTFTDWEVILVDDASTDQTLAIAKQQQALDPSKISVIGLKKNSGPYHARRVAIAHAHGQYLLFLDSDDELFGNDALFSISKGIIDSGADILVFNMTDNESSPVGLIPYEEFFDIGVADTCTNLSGVEFLRGFLGTYSLNNLAGKAIKTALVATPIVDPSVRLLVAEDRLEVFNALIKADSVSILNRTYYYYRPNESSTTHADLTVAYCHQQAFVEQTIYEELKRMEIDPSDLLSNYIGILVYEIRQLCSHCSCYKSREYLNELSNMKFCTDACKFWLELPRDRRTGGFDVCLRANLFARGWYGAESLVCRAINLVARI